MLRVALLAISVGASLAGCGQRVSAGEEAGGRAAARIDAARIEKGRVTLETHHCGSCHTIPGVAASRGLLAASLEGFGRRSYIAGRVANEPATLARWIIDPESVVPGTLMPAMGVSARDAADMAAYLGSLR